MLLGLFGSRFLAERANRLLSSDEKLLVMDSFSRIRTFGTLPLIVMILGLFSMTYLPRVWLWPAYFAACALLALYFAVMHVIISRRLTKLGINASYRTAYNRARLISYSGFLAFFILNTLGRF